MIGPFEESNIKIWVVMQPSKWWLEAPQLKDTMKKVSMTNTQMISWCIYIYIILTWYNTCTKYECMYIYIYIWIIYSIWINLGSYRYESSKLGSSEVIPIAVVYQACPDRLQLCSAVVRNSLTEAWRLAGKVGVLYVGQTAGMEAWSLDFFWSE